jgi:hypothetical protein
VDAAARRGRIGEYNRRCACIAQLVEQLTLNKLITRRQRIREHADLARYPREFGGGATGTIRPSTSPRMPTSGFEGGPANVHYVRLEPCWSVVNSA